MRFIFDQRALPSEQVEVEKNDGAKLLFKL